MMRCPRLHGALVPIYMNSDYAAPQMAYLCPFCNGVWMRSSESSAFLGVDCEKLLISSTESSMPLICAHCQGLCRQTEIPLENGSFVQFHICSSCKSCFLDSVQFALLFYNQVKVERSVSSILSQSPIDNLGVTCCDCGAEVTNLDDLYDANIGYCCKKCHESPQILSENKIQNVQLVTFHNMEIKIDHWQSSSRSRVSVTPVEPCLLDSRLYTLQSVSRFLRFGYRKTRFSGQLYRYMDGTEDIGPRTPLHVFLKQRGVTSCFEALTQMGDFSLTFKPHSILFEMDAKRMGTDTRIRFESLVRRLLIAYERFVQVTALYSDAEEEKEEST